MVNKIVKDDGSIYFINQRGEYHSENDEPAHITKNSLYWYKNGLLHRENGPAIIHNNGDQEWIIDNRLHREDGPSLIYGDARRTSRYFVCGREVNIARFWEYKRKNNINML